MGILSQYRVLDFGRYIAGPYCGALLAEFGADVIRIEKCDGSEDRFVTPVASDGAGSMFLQMNRNKRGITLNPMKPEGREVMARLVATADVVVANMPDQGLEAMGLDYPSLTNIQPDIILTKISSFGSTGPYADRLGFDGLGQAMSGAAYLSGQDGRPAKSIATYVDFSTAMMAAFGTVLALKERAETGRGQVVEGNLLASALTTMSGYLLEEAVAATGREGSGNRSQAAAPSDIIPTKDGWFMTQVVGNQIFARWCDLIGHPELRSDERFATDELRAHHGEFLSELAREHAATMTTAEVLSAYATANVPAGPVLSPAGVLADPHVKAAGYFEEMAVPGLPDMAPIARAPIRLSESAGAIHCPAPKLGEHTDEILKELGFSGAELARFREGRVI